MKNAKGIVDIEFFRNSDYTLDDKISQLEVTYYTEIIILVVIVYTLIMQRVELYKVLLIRVIYINLFIGEN